MKYQTTRQECEDRRPRSKKLTKFLETKKLEKEMEMYEFPVERDDTELDTLELSRNSIFTDEDWLQRSKYGTRCALDYYPTTFRPSEWEGKSYTPSQREGASRSDRRRQITPEDMKTSLRSIMSDKVSGYRRASRSLSPSRMARAKAVPHYARPRCSSVSRHR